MVTAGQRQQLAEAFDEVGAAVFGLLAANDSILPVENALLTRLSRKPAKFSTASLERLAHGALARQATPTSLPQVLEASILLRRYPYVGDILGWEWVRAVHCTAFVAALEADDTAFVRETLPYVTLESNDGRPAPPSLGDGLRHRIGGGALKDFGNVELVPDPVDPPAMVGTANLNLLELNLMSALAGHGGWRMRMSAWKESRIESARSATIDFIHRVDDAFTG